MLQRLSIEWKLPLAICSVLMAVVGTLSVLAYREVAGSARRAAEGRVENFAGQLAGTFQASVDKGLVRLGAKASQLALCDYLRAADPSEAAAEAARTALTELLDEERATVDFAAVELLDLDRRRLLAVGPDRERVAELALDELVPEGAVRALVHDAEPEEAGAVGPLVALGESVGVPALVTVRDGKEPLGFVVRWSSIQLSAESRERLAGLLAPQAAAYLGSPGGHWIDWERIVPEPPLAAPANDAPGTSAVARVERPDGARLAAAARVPGTPWTIVVEYPERLVTAPARRFLEHVGVAAILLFAAGLGGVWLVARRITAPLRELTDATESLVGGSPARGAGEVREDELDRLRASFLRMSERVQEAHRGLEAKVVELRGAREREEAARAEAEEANSRKDEFLAMLAHELRNPLSPILCALAVVRSPRAEPAMREEAFAAIERQVRNMTRIVDDLLDVSRITRGKVALKRRPADVASLVRNAVETSRPLIEAKEHRVVCELPERPLAIEVDATRIEQVLANLVTNAAKYTEPGGTIRVSAAREGDEVVLRVRDDGIGIPPDKLGRVFDLFHQVDHSIDRSRGGLGIGLTLVRKLVELHDGSVTASSDGPGRGSEFVVRLPAGATVDGAAAVGVPAASLAASNGSPERVSDALRILVVEDARDTRDLLELVLELDGHEVMTAGDGDEGLARFRSFDPQVVVLDIGLPGLNGFEVARHIRAEKGAEVLLIAATGYGDAKTRARALEVGFDAHLVKPIAHTQLTSMLSRRGPERRRLAAGGAG